MFRISRNDPELAGFHRVQCFVAKENAEIAIAFNPSVAADAVFVQDGLDLAAEVDRFFPAGPKKATDNYGGNKYPGEPVHS